MRVIVCGGRDYTDAHRIWSFLDQVDADHGIGIVIHGMARGADMIAGKWARARGKVEKAVPADWATNGKAAGPMRNAAMLYFKPDLVIAFPGGAGTRDMVNKAIAAGISVLEVIA